VTGIHEYQNGSNKGNDDIEKLPVVSSFVPARHHRVRNPKGGGLESVTA
jgi:hypothetical protein